MTLASYVAFLTPGAIVRLLVSNMTNAEGGSSQSPQKDPNMVTRGYHGIEWGYIGGGIGFGVIAGAIWYLHGFLPGGWVSTVDDAAVAAFAIAAANQLAIGIRALPKRFDFFQTPQQADEPRHVESNVTMTHDPDSDAVQYSNNGYPNHRGRGY